MQMERSKQGPGWLGGGLGYLKVLPMLAGMLTVVQVVPATNGTWLYSIIITEKNLQRADS